MSSVKDNYGNAKRIVVICDSENPESDNDDAFELINISDLDIDNFPEFVFRYNILELNTAVKPFVFNKLFSQGYEQVVYFDPDIRVFGSLDNMVSLISNHNIVLTPHLTGELDDGMRPNEVDILRAGTYNLGYIGINGTNESKKFLDWWMRRLRTHCVNDISKGLFVDQKWMELAPSLFSGVHITHNPGWNAAYWNVNHRTFTRLSKTEYLVNNEPLIFFHYSGFKHKKNIFSIHQNRFDFENCGNILEELFKLYGTELLENDFDNVSNTEYGYGTYKDGSSIPDILRETYLSLESTLAEPPSLSLDAPSTWLVDFVSQPARSASGQLTPLVTLLSYKIYISRDDLQVAFPDVFAADSLAFAGWFIASAEREYGLSPAFTESTLNAVNSRQSEAPVETTSFRRETFLHLHRSPKLLKALDRLPGQRFRTRLKKQWLGNGSRADKTEALEPHKANGISSNGVNIIGYLHAESGTGEAARSTIRACKAAGLHVSGIDIRKNNVSRMTEDPEIEVVQTPQHDINIFHINADQTAEVFSDLDPSAYEGRYNIGFWFWELEELPVEYLDSYRYLDEIWVASKFCQDAVSRQANVPVSLIPLCIDQNRPTSSKKALAISKKALNLPEDQFLILSCIDMLSIPERKNPLGVLKAFEQLCLEQKGVHLVLKLSNLDRCTKKLKEEVESYVKRLPVILIDRYLERPELNSLMANSDCYFSMHRSEGFGLPLAEAMSMGVPVVATGWSSNTDFMTVNNSFLIKYELVTLNEDHGPYRKGQVWADPNLNHAVSCLREVITNSKLRDEKASRALRDISQLNSAEYVGERIKARVNAISNR